MFQLSIDDTRGVSQVRRPVVLSEVYNLLAVTLTGVLRRPTLHRYRDQLGVGAQQPQRFPSSPLIMELVAIATGAEQIGVGHASVRSVTNRRQAAIPFVGGPAGSVHTLLPPVHKPVQPRYPRSARHVSAVSGRHQTDATRLRYAVDRTCAATRRHQRRLGC